MEIGIYVSGLQVAWTAYDAVLSAYCVTGEDVSPAAIRQVTSDPSKFELPKLSRPVFFHQ